MLAFISDLHFSDGTAIAGNVTKEAFTLALRELYELAAQVARARDRPTRLDLVLMGDIFDLLRTERWFEDREGNPVPLAERPWATAEALVTGGVDPRVAARGRAMVDEIVDLNAEALAMLRGECAPPPEGVIVRRIYMPGNHDRLYLLDAGIRARILSALGAVDGTEMGEEGFHLHSIERPDHGVIARHGHEWDVWNFPGYRRDQVASLLTPADYVGTPIGDPVTTEMAARLPYELGRRLREERGFSPDLARRIHDHFKRIDDVRPLFASFHWAYYAAERVGAELDRARARALGLALDDTVRCLARGFRELDIYQAWEASRHTPGHLDAAVMLKLVLWGMSQITAPLRKVAELVESALVGWSPIDAARRGSEREDLSRVGSEEMRFVVYGHTHLAAQISLRARERTQDVYLNTGTYRPGVFRAEGGRGFIGWQRLGYVCLASADEAVLEPPVYGGPSAGPAFVAWTGARSHGAPSHAGGPTVK